MSDWQLQVAKNKFSERVRRAREEGPQTVTVHGKPAVVVVDAAEFARLGACGARHSRRCCSVALNGRRTCCEPLRIGRAIPAVISNSDVFGRYLRPLGLSSAGFLGTCVAGCHG